jgi:hypothetical protein
MELRTAARIVLATVLAAGAGLSSGRDHVVASHPTTCIAIYFEPGNLPNDVILRPTFFVSQIFEKSGLRLVWHGPRRRNAPDGRCDKSLDVGVIPKAPTAASRDALAAAQAFGSAVTLYLDRIELFLRRTPGDRCILFAYILAHELGHVIEGFDRHSDSGILKERWTDADFSAMRLFHLQFAEEDVDLIRRGARGTNHPLPKFTTAAAGVGR